MIWVKDGGGGFGSIYTYYQNTEYMFVFTKGKPKSVNLIKDHKNKYAGEHRSVINHRRIGGERDVGSKRRIVHEYSKRNNWWLLPRSQGYKNHPATFPVWLVRDHIISWSNPGDVVLDCFMGSGTTGVACVDTDRDFVGIEISEEYYNMAKERVEEAVKAKGAV